MEDEKRNSGDPAATAAKNGSGDENVASEAKSPEAGGANDATLSPATLQELQAENEELKDKNLRLRAEVENTLRRTEREKADFAKYAIAEFARDVVGVGDNIRRAIESVPKDALSPNSPLTSLLEGVQVTERELLKVLERYQVTRFDPKGEQFNPHLHDAMTKVEQPNVPANTVVQVIHAGYMIGERVLRPAAVIVAKGGSVEQQPAKSHADSAIPPGAMKVPDNAISSLDVRNDTYQETKSTAFGRQLGNDKKHSGVYEGASEQEGVAQFRRSISVGVGDSAKSQQGGAGGKGTNLNTPILSPKSK
jgi:molecular chaperone GrpE